MEIHVLKGVLDKADNIVVFYQKAEYFPLKKNEERPLRIEFSYSEACGKMTCIKSSNQHKLKV